MAREIYTPIPNHPQGFAPDPRLCRKSPPSGRERPVFSPGKDGEAGDVASIVDTAGRSQADNSGCLAPPGNKTVPEKGPLETRATLPTVPSLRVARRCGLWFMAVCLLGATSNAYAWGVAVKGGFQRLESPISFEKTERARFEAEVSSGDFFSDYLELAFSVGGSSLGSVEDTFTTVGPTYVIDETFEDSVYLFDGRLTARVYPWGGAGGRDPFQIIPYVGGGVGYFHMETRWEDTYVETGPTYVYIEEHDGTDRLANGFFPFLTAGVNVPLNAMSELLFEFQFDFEKEDAGWDLGGPTFLLGCRFRTR